MSLACFWAVPLDAQQNPNGQVPVAGLADAYLILIRDPIVQQDLKLNDQQKQAISTLTDELDMTLWTLRNQPSENAAEGYRKLITTAETRMGPILSAVQQKRLEQIRMLAAGWQALLRDDSATRLKLSTDQRTRIEQLLRKAQAAASGSAGTETNGKKIAAKPEPAANDTSTRIAAILSPEQIAAARKLFGPPLETSRLGFVKFKAPDIAGPNDWINSTPLTLSQLRGKVVALHFWTYG